MEQQTLKNVNNGLNANIYFYLEKSCGKNFNLYLSVVHFFNTIRHFWQLKTVVFLHRCLMCAVLLSMVSSKTWWLFDELPEWCWEQTYFKGQMSGLTEPRCAIVVDLARESISKGREKMLGLSFQP